MITDRALAQQIEATLDRFHGGDLVEIRAIGKATTWAGYFTDYDKAAHEALELDKSKSIEGIYFTLNTLHPGLIHRSPDRITQGLKPTTSDRDVIARKWALVDCDPIRPAGISSTEEELAAAREVRDHAYEMLLGWGWPPDHLVRADSGNGAHVLLRISGSMSHLAGDQYVASVLSVLAQECDTDLVKIDQSVTNAARITKLYGTVAKKGYSFGKRPHRRSCIVS